MGRFLSVDPVLGEAATPQAWNRYAYVRNRPLNYTDPTGEVADIAVDIGFIAYDLGDIAASVIAGEGVSGEQVLALAADIVGAAIPFATGLGAAVRVASKGDGAVDAVKGASNLGDGLSGTQSRVGSLDELSRAAGAPDRNGLTVAGRSLQKHASRPGSAFATSSRRASDLNEAGQDVVDDILTTPGSVRRNNRLGGVDVVTPDGRGVRFRADGTFRNLLEPSS